MKPRVFVTRELPGIALDRVSSRCELSIWKGDAPPPHKILMEKAHHMEGLLCLLTDCVDKAVMKAAGSRLKVISNYAVGFDNIDVATATSLRIPVGNTPGVLTETTADFAFALLFSLARRIVEGASIVRSGGWHSWSPTLLLGSDVYGATLGILGMGRIGQAVARRAVGFKMNVVFHDPSHRESQVFEGAKSVSFSELVSTSDYLSLHVPLNDITRHIINRDVFKEMKPTAHLINTARGQVIDQDALYDALKNGQIAGAALDVTEPEPLPGDHRLHTLTNCLIVPHLGSASTATRSKMAVMAAENLLAGLNNERLPHCVNPEVYKTIVAS